MSDYNYEITDGGLDSLKYLKSLEGSECDNTDESDSDLVMSLGACCFLDNNTCINYMSKSGCEYNGGVFYPDQKCENIQCTTTAPTSPPLP